MSSIVNNKTPKIVTVTSKKIPDKPSSTPKKNDETSDKLPNYSDCVLSNVLFP